MQQYAPRTGRFLAHQRVPFRDRSGLRYWIVGSVVSVMGKLCEAVGPVLA